ncbi:MAG: type II secretion system F family protein [Candidatus Pacebacteria bacterium]|mgnify:CR=1 FL=1|jgi:type IV pilus assembly protein PilC|nr:type II secretion system F family protein [Candidatus Paceibacterota bacterium]MBT3511935.1 type II secretion system F family protein [Candidatus Paceibacterota bacterium]MBT4005257.1 type II secretion system F family protein [Candidatus Paceibacterota bacterium]MBT4358977.1 type II secretion system F family protein [Candidatus Paceibacterota bacterium]MBT4680458.1 type II secretion system F family protein [Candidatus Paceibacterota bacterium]
MPFFKYTAKNEHSETVKGKVEARSISVAASILASRSLLVINIAPLEQGSFTFIKNMTSGIKEDDVVNMTRQLSTMITAGLPLSTSLSILAEQGRSEVSILINELLRDIEGGKTFSQALEKKPKVFSRVYVQLIRAGEAGGVIDEILSRLADTLEKQKEFRGKTKGALIYPAIIVTAMLGVGFVMMVVVIPKLTEMYQDFGADLPFVTQLLIDISDVFVKYWWAMISFMVAGGFLFRSWRKTEAGDRSFDRFLLKIPVFGELKEKVIVTEFARTLSLLLSAGVSLISALRIVSEAIESINYRDSLEAVAKKVEKGIPMSQALSASETFPPILYQMTSVGEETGKLDEILLKLSIYFETESEQAVKNLTTALEPAIMIVLGLSVGVMVVAIIMPIYSLTSQF